MRAARPFLLLALVCAVVAVAHSQTAPGAGLNLLQFAKGSPNPAKGGVDVGVTQKPTAGFTCTEITIRVVRVSDAKTLDTHTVANPGATLHKSFSGLPGNTQVRVAVEATFKSGGKFDFRDIEARVITK
jgi:hypothetical protein